MLITERVAAGVLAVPSAVSLRQDDSRGRVYLPSIKYKVSAVLRTQA